MIQELVRAVEPGASIEVDILIVGAGPAGITLALELQGAGYKVLLAEAGGLDLPFQQAASHYEAESVGLPYPVAASRQRYFGGTSNHWGGWCRPLDPIDLEERPWVPHSGWPIGYEELEPWYERAHRILEIPSQVYQAEGQVPQNWLLPSSPDETFLNQAFRFSPPTRFGQAYRGVLAEARGIQVLVNATVTAIRHENGRVHSCLVADPEGGERLIRPGRVVLATGGLEVPRMLLHTETAERAALGNRHDWVGRCFMEHFGYTPGFVMTRPELRYGLHRPAENAPRIHPVLVPAAAIMRAQGLMNCFMTLTAVAPDSAFPPEFLQSSGLARSIQEKPWRYRLTMVNEPRPNRASRVSLGEDVDVFGLRKLRLDWRVDPDDFSSIEKTIHLLSAWLGRTGLGRFQYTRPISPETTSQLSGGLHHMGTARMSKDATRGVVDVNCRVHGTENLYIASSAVFPTAGYANPTLTIVALSLRLAHHLKGAAS